MKALRSFALCVCSVNVEYHFVDLQEITPPEMRGKKFRVKDIVFHRGSDEQFDVIIQAEHKEIVYPRITAIKTEVAGSSANIAYMFKKLGELPVVMAAVGDDRLGRLIQSHLEHDGIAFVPLVRQGGTAVTVAVSDKTGDTTLFCLKPSYSIDYDFALKGIRGLAAKIVVSTSAIDSQELSLAERLFDIFSGSFRSFIPHYEVLDRMLNLETVISHSQVFQVNEREARLIAGEGALDKARASILANTIASTGIVLVTLGESGSYVVDRQTGEIFHQDAFPAHTVDTTGSGDAFHAAFLYSLAFGRSKKEAAQFASWAAARNTEGRGGHFAQVSKESFADFWALNGG